MLLVNLVLANILLIVDNSNVLLKCKYMSILKIACY